MTGFILQFGTERGGRVATGRWVSLILWQGCWYFAAEAQRSWTVCVAKFRDALLWKLANSCRNNRSNLRLKT